jgi:hypothetical protein
MKGKFSENLNRSLNYSPSPTKGVKSSSSKKDDIVMINIESDQSDAENNENNPTNLKTPNRPQKKTK